MILLLFVLLVLVISTQIIVNNSLIEKYTQELSHQIAHFGGVPSQAQIWPNMIKYPKQYV